MARTLTHSCYVTVDIDLADALLELSDDDLRKECVRRGILAQAEEPKAEQHSISLPGNEMAEIADVIRYGDLEGAMLRLERMLPRDFRVFSDRLGRGAHQ